MKKIKLILCMSALVLGLTACSGVTEKKELKQDTAARVNQITQDLIENLYNAVPQEEVDSFVEYGPEYMELVCDQYFGYKVDGNGIINGFDSWNNALSEIGEYQSITGMIADYDEQGKDIVVKLDIQGANRTAQVEAIYKDDLYNTLSSITTNVNYTLGEKMKKAALNTLMGMGTVFIVLIIISLIISLFGFIPSIKEAFSKNKSNGEVAAESVDNTIAQIIEKEEQTDDLELIAVITAAIAAAGTSGSADDFVVRSVRRRSSSQWNKA